MEIFYPFGNEYWTKALDCVFVCSSLIALYIAMKIILNKHLQSHPAPLIAVLCSGGSVFSMTGVSRYIVCGGSPEGFIAATIFFDTSEAS